jgi:hypothetical protein
MSRASFSSVSGRTSSYSRALLAKKKKKMISTKMSSRVFSASASSSSSVDVAALVSSLTTTNAIDIEKVKSGLKETFEMFSEMFSGRFGEVQSRAAEEGEKMLRNIDALSSSSSSSNFINTDLENLRAAMENLERSIDPLTLHSMETIVGTHPVLSGVLAAFASGSLSVAIARAFFGQGGLKDDELPKVYDSEKIAKYWMRRPLAVMKRSAGLMAEILTWATALIGDVTSNSVEQNAPIRAKALKELIARQGAAFVKVGQAVAIRPDLLPPAYLEEFQTLLDQVEAFPSEDARKLIQKTIGENVRLEDVFEDVSCFDKPIAAASIGQVYKATLKKGALKKSGE